MQRHATVVNVDGKLMAEVVRTEACGNCRACGLGLGEKALFELPLGEYSEGDTVTLSLEGGKLSLASLLGYGVPLAALLAGLLLGSLIFEAEAAQAIFTIVCLILGCAWLAFTEKKRRASGKFASCASVVNDKHKPGD